MANRNKPRLLDLFCGVGGAGTGYHNAGFEVVGVDIRPQPHYPFEFHQADALTFDTDHFDAIHASPPCQGYSVANWRHLEYPDLLAETRNILNEARLPWVIENVPGAPMRRELLLCGSMFGLRVKRHRFFEFNYWAPPMPPAACNHKVDFLDMYSSGKQRNGTERQYVDEMGVTWAPVRLGNRRYAGTEAIPPAYTEWIGKQLMEALKIAA